MRSSSPLKLMEYLAVAKPVIVTRIEAFTEALRGSVAGIFIEDNRPASIAAAIRHAYEHRARLPDRGRSGRQVVEGRFTWDRQAAVLEAYLRKGVV